MKENSNFAFTAPKLRLMKILNNPGDLNNEFENVSFSFRYSQIFSEKLKLNIYLKNYTLSSDTLN